MDTTAKLQSPSPADDLEKIPVEQVLRKLTVKADAGLSKAEAAQRLIKYGPNALVEKEVSWARKILGPFTGPIAYMIEAAAIVSAILHRWQDFVIIAVLLLFNAGLELWQDLKASNALAALKKGLAPKATALRDRKWETVDAATLVPGDIVKIRLGMIVHPRFRHGRRQRLSRHRRCRHMGHRRPPQYPPICLDSADRLDPGRDAGGILDHHGAGCSRSFEREGDRLPAVGHRRNGRR